MVQSISLKAIPSSLNRSQMSGRRKWQDDRVAFILTDWLPLGLQGWVTYDLQTYTPTTICQF